ncbi:hypothetical protein GCM10027601_04530 [Nocardioides ungokensis]
MARQPAVDAAGLAVLTERDDPVGEHPILGLPVIELVVGVAAHAISPRRGLVDHATLRRAADNAGRRAAYLWTSRARTRAVDSRWPESDYAGWPK